MKKIPIQQPKERSIVGFLFILSIILPFAILCSICALFFQLLCFIARVSRNFFKAKNWEIGWEWKKLHNQG
jgi:hypothetical protein